VVMCVGLVQGGASKGNEKALKGGFMCDRKIAKSDGFVMSVRTSILPSA
jgi:hypothetical protein